MRFPPLVYGRLVRRYKRFLADIVLEDGSEVTAHCANPGAMLGLTRPGDRVALSVSSDPRRKLAHSWELVEVSAGAQPGWIGINTALPNRLVEAAVRADGIAALAGYAGIRREVAYGRASRIDLLLEAPGRPPCYVEVKNAHLFRAPGLAEFPDCVTARGAKHLAELADQVEAGARSVMVYLIQAPASAFALAADLDPAYARAFSDARRRGVEAIALACRVSPEGIQIDREVPILEAEGRGETAVRANSDPKGSEFASES